MVTNIEMVVDELIKRGVVFEQYNIEGSITTNEKGIAELEGYKAAWFKDLDENILAISEIKEKKFKLPLSYLRNNLYNK